MQKSARDAYDYLIERVGTTLDETGDAFPYFADQHTGEWVTTENGNWCGGHWIHMLWRAFQRTDDDQFERAARAHTKTIDDYMPRQAMFCGMNFHYAGFRAYDVTHEEVHRELGIKGADAMVEYFHKDARQIPLGILEIESPSPEFRGPVSDEGPSGNHLGAVDAIYTSLPVLWRAYAEMEESAYRDTAVSHADRHLDWYIRDDGSTWHHAEFDPKTGALVRQYNELAYSDETCWARGQGWCIAGLARAYEETQAERYLDALEKTVDYYVAHSPEDLVPYWDFEHPDKPDVQRDTSAAALTAYGLVRLTRTSATARLIDTGEQILSSLVKNYMTPLSLDDRRPDGMTVDGCYNGPSGFADRNELIWTDYYVLEALAATIT